MYHMTGAYGQWWLGFFSFVESIFLPVPTDTIMMIMLFAKDNARRWFYYATLTMVTSVLGAFAGYMLAFWLFDAFGPYLISLYGLEHEFAMVQHFLNHGVFVFTFIGAVSPIPFKLFVLTAGFMKIDFWVFMFASVIGRSIRLYVSAWLVYAYGRQSLALVKKYSVHITIIALAVLLVYILGYIWI